jgi:hypothetical protein
LARQTSPLLRPSNIQKRPGCIFPFPQFAQGRSGGRSPADEFSRKAVLVLVCGRAGEQLCHDTLPRVLPRVLICEPLGGQLPQRSSSSAWLGAAVPAALELSSPRSASSFLPSRVFFRSAGMSAMSPAKRKDDLSGGSPLQTLKAAPAFIQRDFATAPPGWVDG